MKKTIFILCIAAAVCGCNNETTHPKTNISDCNPNLNELRLPSSKMSHKMPAEDIVISDEEYIELMNKHILSVSCTDEKTMYIVYYDPSFTCCLTPHSSCTRSGDNITINGWDTGLNPCDCNCPRKIEATMTDVAYGKYTFSLKHEGKLQHTVNLDFTAETDTLIVL